MIVDLDKVFPDPDQPRKKFTRESLEELANSIARQGLMQPITVRPRDKERGTYFIVAGERRWRAHQLLRDERGHAPARRIEVLVRKPSNVIDLRARQIAENVARADLSILEEARSYADLMALGLGEEEAAGSIGVRLTRFRARLSLLNLEPGLQTLVDGGALSGPNALEIARLTSHADQTRIVQMINRGELGKWKSVKAAVDAILDKLSQADIFGETDKATPAEIETVNAMESRIDKAAAALAKGWKNGECVVAMKVAPDRAGLMADKLEAMRRCIRLMESELRHVQAQAKLAGV